MIIHQTVENGILKIALEGQLDTVTAEDLRKVLDSIQESYQEAVFDFAKLNWISSAGLRQLLTVRKRLSRNEDLRVINCSDMVRDVFVATTFDSMMTVSELNLKMMQNCSFKQLLQMQAERH